jgi:Family of unknown function (DUF5995)
MADTAKGRFHDGARMATFIQEFAARYLDARTGTAPGCWRASFSVGGDAHLLVVQHLFLGINAHVNFDLPQTVVKLADQTGDLASIRPDFESINDVLHDTYGDVLGDLDRVTRWTGQVAAMGGGHLFNFSLRAARDQAWRTAVRLHGLAPDARPADVGALDHLVCVLAYLITRPTLPFRWMVPLARRLETHDPVKVTEALLGPLG